MDFSLSEEQRIFIHTARGFLDKEAKDLYRQFERTEHGYSKEFWRRMAELGWMGLLFPEELGGIDGTILDTILLLEEMGRALVPGPFIPTTICGHSILKFADELNKREIIPKIASGTIVITHAFLRPSSKGSSTSVDEMVKEEKDFFSLNGLRIFVPYGSSADLFLYRAEHEGKTALFFVDSRSEGVTCRPLETISGSGQCELFLREVKVPKEKFLGQGEKAEGIIRCIEELGALLHSAYILGMLGRVMDMAVTHAKQRVQFERPIGSFQAIQHQLADMMTEIEKLRYLTYQAAWKLDEGIDARKDVAMAKAKASIASRNVTLLGIKIHGGIGITEEHDLQLYFRMAKEQEIAFGDGDFHYEVVAREMGI